MRTIHTTSEEETTEAGKNIAARPASWRVLYLGSSGRNRVSTVSSQAEGDARVGELGPGDFFGEIALIDGCARTASAVATGRAELFLVGRRDFLDLLGKSPRMLADVLLGLSTELRRNEAAA